MSSGVTVSDECLLKFLELRNERSLRFITFKIDGQTAQVVLDVLGQPDETYDDFIATLPADDCRYAVFDLDLVADDNSDERKIIFISWSPDAARTKSKMMYAGSKATTRRKFVGVQVELVANDPSEISMDVVIEKAASST